MRRAKALEGSQFDHRLDLPFEENRQYKDVEGWGFPQTRADLDIVAWYVGKENAVLFQGTLSYQALAQSELGSQVLACLVSVAREEPQPWFVFGGVLHEVESAVLHRDQRGKLGQDEPRHSQQILLARQPAREPGQLCFQPILLAVL